MHIVLDAYIVLLVWHHPRIQVIVYLSFDEAAASVTTCNVEQRCEQHLQETKTSMLCSTQQIIQQS